MPMLPFTLEHPAMHFSAMLLLYWVFTFALAAPLALAALGVRFAGQKKKIFPHLLAAQAAPPFLAGTWLAYAAMVLFLFMGNPNQHTFQEIIQSPLLLAIFGGAAFLLVGLTLGATRWKAWRKKASLHALFLLVLALANLALLPLFALGASLLHNPTQEVHGAFKHVPLETAQAFFSTLFLPEFFPANALALLHLAGTGFALAALLAGLRVALRRNKDDFGRDYYTYATRTTAWWAAGAGVLFTLTTALAPQSLSAAGDFLADLDRTLYIAAALGGMATLLWGVVGTSSTPLRLKWLFFLAGLFFCAAFAVFYPLSLPTSLP